MSTDQKPDLKAGKHRERMMANVITGFRIFVSVVLLFCPMFSPIFYTLYLIAGFSDMADGSIARKTNTVSEFGARFDSIADLVFVIVCLIKFLPVMDIPIGLYVPLIYTGILIWWGIPNGYLHFAECNGRQEV